MFKFKLKRMTGLCAIMVIAGVMFVACNDESTPSGALQEPNTTDISASADLTVNMENGGGPTAAEGSRKLIDGDKYSKFLIGGFSNPSNFWAQQIFNNPVRVNAYTMTAGNDAPERDPKNWELKGSNDGTNWETITTVEDASFATRNKTNIYRLESQVSYQYYRLDIIENYGSGLMQMSEWGLINYNDEEGTAVPPDTTSGSAGPRIESISPSEGEPGSELTINGINFGSNASDITVMIGGMDASINSATGRQINATIPTGLALKSYVVYVMVNGNLAAAPNAVSLFNVFVATSQNEPSSWTYTDYVPNYEDLAWTQMSYDDSGWQSGDAPFGSDYDGVRTNWDGFDIYLRKTFTIDNLSSITSGEGQLYINMMHDDWSNVYINGVQAAAATGANGSYNDFAMSQESIDALQEGENIIAVHTHDNGGGQFIDLGIVYR